jgi:hypothetical protein
MSTSGGIVCTIVCSPLNCQDSLLNRRYFELVPELVIVEILRHGQSERWIFLEKSDGWDSTPITSSGQIIYENDLSRRRCWKAKDDKVS